MSGRRGKKKILRGGGGGEISGPYATITHTLRGSSFTENAVKKRGTEKKAKKKVG